MYLGVDAGGTKTEALLIAENGERLATARFGPGNWEAIGVNNALKLYAHVIDSMCRQASVDPAHLRSVGWGLAGLDWPSDHDRLAPGISALLPGATHICVNDAFLPLRAGSTRSYGVAVIAGTGSTVAAIGRTGRRARTYGLGSDWGDFDGAQQLTRAAFRATARAEYGLEPATVLTQELLNWANITSIAALAEAFSRGGDVPDAATFAPMVMRCADAGDAIAKRIVIDAAQLLAQNICAMSHAVGLEDTAFDVVLAGGVATGAGPLFQSTITQAVHALFPLAHILVLRRPPVIGALLLAMDAVGCQVQLNLREW